MKNRPQKAWAGLAKARFLLRRYVFETNISIMFCLVLQLLIMFKEGYQIVIIKGVLHD